MKIVTLLDGERETFTGAQRWGRGITQKQAEDGALETVLPADDPTSDAFWYVREFGGSLFVPIFHQLGYEQIGVITFFRTDIELWARPGANLDPPSDRGTNESAS